MFNIAWRPASLVAVLVVLTACGGGGGGGSGNGGGSGGGSGPSYSISVSPTSVSLSGVSGATPPTQPVVVTFVGAGVVVGTPPGETAPSWLIVNAPSHASSPLTVGISAAASVLPGSYSTTLRFVTGPADASSAVYTDVQVTLQMVAGAQILIDPYGVAQNSSVAVTLNNGTPQTVLQGQINTFGVYAVGSNYTLTVPAQPPGQACTFPGGSSTTTGVLGNNTLELPLNCNASLIPWTWVGGSKSAGEAVVYGTRLTPSASDTPGARALSAYARDAAGNLWLFGGEDNGSASNARNDLWRYAIASGTWTWVSGSNGLNALGVYGALGKASGANAPGARYGGAAWLDANGNVWLFGGMGYGASADGMGYLNDLWMYNVAADTWTWMGGANDINNATVGTYGTTPSVSNIPGGRAQATVVTDTNGAAWLFGGFGLGSTISMGLMNDLWKFDPASGVWTWVSGSNQPGTTAVPGTQGVPAALNNPGGRAYAAGWADGAGDIWIFGGTNLANVRAQNDLWRFNTSTGIWTWMSGTDPTSNLVAVGIYNAPGTTNGNVPSGRSSAAAWTDAAGNLWLFGGTAITEGIAMAPASANDLWKYTPSTNTWLWLSGSNAANAPAVFGTQGVASNTNVPSGRNQAAAWTDPSGKLWLWGGATLAGDTTDVWSVVPQ